jgi:hypothetical protein
MKRTVLGVTNWFACDPRRVVVIVMVVLTVVALTLAVVPNHIALAGEITSGS